MRRSFGLCLVLALLCSVEAFAQKVVILEFENDKGGKLRTQVETALKAANTVSVVSIGAWKAAAAKKKLKGLQAMLPAGVAKVAPGIGVDAAVEGIVGKKLLVRIFDSAGQELWSKELKLKGALLSPDYAKKLANAITAAAQPKDAPPPEEKPEKTPEEKAPEEKQTEETPAEVVPTPAPLSTAEKDKRREEEQAELRNATKPIEPEDRDRDLDSEGVRRSAVRPKFLSLWLAGTTTWRSYCSRPGVSSCGEYANKNPKPQGDTVEFSPQVPYAGFSIAAEAFPLVLVTDNPLRGIGVVGSFSLGFSLTNVKVQSPQGETPEKQVVSTDRSFTAQLAYRYFFSFGTGKDQLFGYAGARFGVGSRVFEIDANAQVPLPGSFRTYPQLGLDASVPLGSKYARIEAAFTFLINPKAGPDEIAGYGNVNAQNGGASGSGFSFEGGLAGDLWGPIGYQVRFRYLRYGDQFFGDPTQTNGGGNKWTVCNDTQCGGAAEEVYTGLLWGVTASF